jgi:hypothetical protein
LSYRDYRNGAVVVHLDSQTAALGESVQSSSLDSHRHFHLVLYQRCHRDIDSIPIVHWRSSMIPTELRCLPSCANQLFYDFFSDGIELWNCRGFADVVDFGIQVFAVAAAV